MEYAKDYTTRLFQLASPLFLYLVSFRRKVGKGYQVGLDMVRADIDQLFVSLDREARDDPRVEALYAKAKYPLVVLTDEVLLNSEWEHAQDWQRGQLLEERLFQTNIGGDKIFQIASELRFEDVEMAAILFTVIALGVRGTYHHKPEKLAEVKAKLYRQLSEYLAESKGQITPGAYHVLAQGLKKVSPAITLLRILIVGFGIVVLYWIVTRGLWLGLVSELRAVVAGLG